MLKNVGVRKAHPNLRANNDFLYACFNEASVGWGEA